MATKTQLGWTAGGIAAVLGGVAGIIHYLGIDATTIWTKQSDAIVARHTDFKAAIALLEEKLYVEYPDLVALRGLAFEAYRRASDTPPKATWKCQVVDAIWNASDPQIAQTTPLNAYADYRNAALTCDDHILALARLDWDAFHVLRGHDSKSNERLQMAQRVVAKGTAHDSKGWIYIGRTEGAEFSVKYVVEPSAEVGQLVTVAYDNGLALQEGEPDSSNRNESGIVGFLPLGSRYMIVQLKSIPEHLTGAPDAHYIWAKADVAEISNHIARSTKSVSAHMAFVQRVRPTRMVAAQSRQAVCPPFRQHNSLHAATQRWIFVGVKQGASSTAFLPHTSLLDTECIPRDGAIVRPTRDLKVLVGPDPHWPGVAAAGGFLAAGTPIHVVGDISGYPFDASDNPDFCKQDPKPERDFVQIRADHQKRYCVYIPFSPA